MCVNKLLPVLRKKGEFVFGNENGMDNDLLIFNQEKQSRLRLTQIVNWLNGVHFETNINVLIKCNSIVVGLDLQLSRLHTLFFLYYYWLGLNLLKGLAVNY